MKRFFGFFVFMIGCMAAVQAVASDCTPVDKSWTMADRESFEQLITSDAAWYYDAAYNCAVASTSSADVESWLMTPALDLREAIVVSFAFDHAHKFGGDVLNELTLWVTPDYTGDPATTQWWTLPIPIYSDQINWHFYSNTISVPLEYIGEKTVFGFRYKTTEENHAKWEIRNITLKSTCKGGPQGDTPAGRLRVCGQNMQNYYFHYDNYESTRANYDHAAFAAKTSKIVSAFLLMNADIYALCEIEACPEVLKQLADSLNKYVGETRFAAVEDGINEPWDSYDNNLKSGFLYRVDKVQPFKKNTAASTWNYYCNTMRIQAFEELSSGERFVLSMNHFKAKTGNGGDDTRRTNAQHLINALSKSLGDPDILLLGDLNCEVGEEPIIMLNNAGFTEQLLRFDPEAYSHCYSGQGSLIDHALANSTMRRQIVDARMYHICTTKCGINNYATSYSDHDPYVVDMNLGEYLEAVDGVEVRSDLQEQSSKSQKLLINGNLYILYNGRMYNGMGIMMK